MSSTFFLCFLSATLLALPFLLPMAFPLAWCAFIPLFRIVHEAGSSRRSLFSGWLIGGLANLFCFYWLVYTVKVFGGFSYGISVAVYLLFGALEGLQIGLFAILVGRLGFGPLNLFPPLFWVILEFWFPLLFPWHLANTQTAFLMVTQSADLVGPYGTSFLVMWANAAIYDLLFAPGRKLGRSLVAAAAVSGVIVAALFYGHARLAEVASRMAKAPKLKLAAVQGNIDVDLKWDPKRARQNLEVYRKLTERIESVDLVLWPETSVEEWVPEDLDRLPPELSPPRSLDRAYFIFGARSFRGGLSGPNLTAFNSAFLADPEGRMVGFYHKQFLLAFGEYIPFATLLSHLPGVPPLAGFTPGGGPHTLDLPGGVKIAPLICYEDLKPGVSRGFVMQKDANLLVNLTNDAWYGRSAAPWQHAWLAQWRAIETRRSLVRVTNTGVTSVINARGEMVRSLPIFTADVLIADVEILDGDTFYARFGDWFAWGATVISLGIVFIAWRKTARSGQKAPFSRS